MTQAEIIAASTFLGVTLFVLIPYYLLVVRPEAMARAALRQRVRTGGGLVQQTTAGILKEVEKLSVIGPLNQWLTGQSAFATKLRDLIQFWTEEATATIEDNSRYRSERGYRVLRRSSVARARATAEMYREFARRIELDLPGDDHQAIHVSARAVVELAGMVDRARSLRDDVDPR